MKITCMIVKGEVKKTLEEPEKKTPILAKHDLSRPITRLFIHL